MNRIDQTLANLAEQGRKALVAYVVAGDPDLDTTVPLLHDLVAAGTDIIELGVAFSDPSAEGPIIQRAHERALANRVGLRQIFAMLTEFRRTDPHTPVVLMGYANPIEWLGLDAFAAAAAEAGADGALTVDLPPEEAAPLDHALRTHGLHNVFLLAPTTSPPRLRRIAQMASGFLYYVSLKGVTGAATLDIAAVEARLAAIRAASRLPVCVGFGIKDAESARAVARLADGVVIGSALVERLAQADSPEQGRAAVRRFLAEIRTALDS